ncbi:unnamed protein product [Miscanthus lutarioriparius]|uniref:Peptidase A1 domain-containing protein n=1 Tax=Miscanthus lutarioriparius TaxID=422564 RepID=A0A811SG91_9POAL|nr:unnamed protein product [Miscanthus lutarioriparius]
MAATTPVTSSPGPPEEQDEGRTKPHHQRVPNGYVMIVVPNDRRDELPASSPPRDADAPEEEREDEEERSPRATSSLWRAAVAVVALAALAVAGSVCLYADGDAATAAWRLLDTREDGGGDEGAAGGRSFLLPLYPKPHRGDNWLQNSTSLFPPLTGNELFPEGMYYTTVSLGNPPRPYFLDVDTGSHTTWIQCDAPCTSCAKGAHPLYRPPARTNLVPASDQLCEGAQHDNPNQCDYDISYADGSSSMGVHVRDNMQFISEDGERENADIVFGCGYDQQGILLNRLENTDGILGLSNQALSLPTQLASRGIISNAFGHCMTRDPSGGGYLFLGDDYLPRWGMTWVPIRDGPADDIRRAQVQQVNHGDQQLNVQGKLTQVIFDSGSTYTYFPNEALIKLISSLKAASPRFVQDDSDKTLPFCMKADFPVRSVDDVKRFFKPLSLEFEKRFFFSRTFNIRPEDYLIISDKGNVCLGVLDGTTIGYDSVIIVGDVSLRGKLIAYDNDENEVGWIDSDCTNPRRQSRIPSFLRRALHNQVL